jgi:5-methylcytosine-specific restriction endonuclease McrA
MSNVLNRTVLVLNRNWLPINSVDVKTALLQLAAGASLALDIRGENHLVPVSWEEWIKLEPLNEEEVIHTSKQLVRQPTVVIANNFDRLVRKRGKFTLANVARRDGFKCQYTGKKLTRDRWSLDHVVPLSRGGRNSPDNVVLADKDVNNRKGSKTPKEAGLPEPVIKRLPDFELPVATHPHHELFLKV